MTAQAVREADEVEAGMRGRLAGGAARLAVVVERAEGVEQSLEAGGEACRGDDRVERLARAVGKRRGGRSGTEAGTDGPGRIRTLTLRPDDTTIAGP